MEPGKRYYPMQSKGTLPSKLADYSEVIQELESRGMMPDRVLSLEPMRIGLGRVLDSSKIDKKKTIVVAGTNGKGSICATLEALFLSAGETIGLYTSPHLEETTERIRVNGQDISRDQFCKAYQHVSEKTVDLMLTHFEMLTLMAAWVFFSGEDTPPVERAIFEVGLGGTWDATNAIPHQYCVIASLGYDHQNLLGNSLVEIASNKFGIITPNATVVHSPLPEEVQGLAKQVQASTQSTWIKSTSVTWKVDHHKKGPQFTIQTQWGDAPLSLAGPRAVQNSATALTLFQAVGYTPGPYLHALNNVRWHGRMERWEMNGCPCPIYLSGDHNPDGIQSLLELLTYYPRSHLYILAGVVKDKDMDGILSPLLALPNSSLFLTETSFRTRTLKDYGIWLERARGAWKSPQEALEKITLLASPDDIILVTGSLYLIGQVKTLVGRS